MLEKQDNSFIYNKLPLNTIHKQNRERQRQRQRQNQSQRKKKDMAEETKTTNNVVVHGMWGSPFVKRVEIALKIKGVPYDYIEEDLKNKSPSLLQLNPVHKKVPVLVHNGKPVLESFIILEYIDEVWKNGPSLLPEDPYERSQIRFWADFIEKLLLEVILRALTTEGEAQEKAIKELKEKLEIFEDGVKNLFSEGRKFVNGDEMGFLDIVMLSLLGVYEIHEEVLGIKFIEEDKIPAIFLWLKNLKEHPFMKETFPPKEKFLGILQFIRQNALQSAAAV